MPQGRLPTGISLTSFGPTSEITATVPPGTCTDKETLVFRIQNNAHRPIFLAQLQQLHDRFAFGCRGAINRGVEFA